MTPFLRHAKSMIKFSQVLAKQGKVIPREADTSAAGCSRDPRLWIQASLPPSARLATLASSTTRSLSRSLGTENIPFSVRSLHRTLRQQAKAVTPVQGLKEGQTLPWSRADLHLGNRNFRWNLPHEL